MIGCQIDGKQFEPVETNVILSSFSFQLTHSLEETPRRVRMHVKAGALSLPWNEGPCRQRRKSLSGVSRRTEVHEELFFAQITHPPPC